MRILIALFFVSQVFCLCSQSLEDQINHLELEIEQVEQKKLLLSNQVEDLRCKKILSDLDMVGLPANDGYVSHRAMVLAYSEAHEQAEWVAHIIIPQIIQGVATRSNDFREDPKILSKSAVQEDYFLTDSLADGTVKYDGFGYDRGHLAPSADFKWSSRALSESFYYSNMSPQLEEFNRGAWADFEGVLRGYIVDHPETQLYVVTGPILEDDLPVIERGINKVSIPKRFFKVALDLKNGEAMGVIMPNQAIDSPLETYVTTVDEVEQLTGLDFFNKADDTNNFEATVNKKIWFPALAQGDVEPIYQPSLPRGHFNTIVAKNYIGNKAPITVVGKVVGSHYSKAGHLWFNLDKRYPNAILSVFIRKEDLVNFEGDPLKFYTGKTITVKGKVSDFGGGPVISIDKESLISVY